MRAKSKRYRLRVGLHHRRRAMHRGRLRLLPHEWHELLEKLDPDIGRRGDQDAKNATNAPKWERAKKRERVKNAPDAKAPATRKMRQA